MRGDTERMEFLLGLAVRAIEVRQAKEQLMTALDEAVTRITTDIDNAIQALNALNDEIANLGSAGADTTALQAAAQKLEDALGNGRNTIVTVDPSTPVADAPTSDTNTTPDSGVATNSDQNA